MRSLRSKKLAALTLVVATAASVSVWLVTPRADASVTVVWTAGHVVVGSGSLTFAVTNYTNSPKNASIFVRNSTGTRDDAASDGNDITGIPPGEFRGRSYVCSSGPCIRSIEVTTTSTSVVPSAAYIDNSGVSQKISSGEFTVKVVKT